MQRRAPAKDVSQHQWPHLRDEEATRRKRDLSDMKITQFRGQW